MRDRGIQWTSVDGNFAGESCIPTPGPAQLHRSRLAHDGDGRRQIPPRVQRANGGERQVGGDPGHQGHPMLWRCGEVAARDWADQSCYCRCGSGDHAPPVAGSGRLLLAGESGRTGWAGDANPSHLVLLDHGHQCSLNQDFEAEVIEWASPWGSPTPGFVSDRHRGAGRRGGVTLHRSFLECPAHRLRQGPEGQRHASHRHPGEDTQTPR